MENGAFALCSIFHNIFKYMIFQGALWLSGRVLNSRPKGPGFEPHRRHCVVSLSKNINPSLVLVQPRKTRPFITERLLMGRKESNQTKHDISKASKGVIMELRVNTIVLITGLIPYIIISQFSILKL